MLATTENSIARLSVIIIMHNEAHNIKECLDSVSFADEWIVVDSGSQDHSVQIAKNWGATVVEQPWLGFGPQKNLALSYATGDWVLSIDADERITPALASEIKNIIQHPSYMAYTIPRLSQYCGKFIHHSGWWPDPVLRLFKRQIATFSDDVVHEKIVTDQAVGALTQTMLHYSFLNLEDVQQKSNRYSTAGAQRLMARGKKVSFSQALTHGSWAFIRTYLIQAGFLDGKHGLMLAISNAEGTYYRYLKAWFAQSHWSQPVPKVSLVVTTYNRPDALRLVLQSVLAQHTPVHQVIVADDGSGADTQALIKEMQTLFQKDQLVHVWHPDQGFRAAAIRNRAIEQATGDYVVFIDGDCVLPNQFIARHQALAESGCFVSGSRILLNQTYTSQLEQAQTITPLLSLRQLVMARIKGYINRLLPLLKLSPSASWRKRKASAWEGAKTCNLGVWREDLIHVGGFDEAYEGWGMEDSDLVVRLLNAGAIHKNGRFSSAVFHLWHPENDRSQLQKNQQRLQALIASQRVKAEQGLGIGRL